MHKQTINHITNFSEMPSLYLKPCIITVNFIFYREKSIREKNTPEIKNILSSRTNNERTFFSLSSIFRQPEVRIQACKVDNYILKSA